MSAPVHVAAAQRSPRFVSLLLSISHIASLLVILIGGLGLLGWMFDIRILKSGIPGMVVMKANTACALLLAGMALWWLQTAQGDRMARSASSLCAVLALLISALTLGERLLGWDVGIDQLLFADSPSATFPGRMALNSALCLTLISLAMLLFDTRPGVWPASLLGVLVVYIAWPTIVGYLYEITSLYTIQYRMVVAFPCALALILLSVGMLCARPDSALLRLLMSSAAGGLMARRLLPAALALPFVVGWLHWQGQLAGLYDSEFGLAFLVTSITVIFTSLIWWSARAIGRLDGERTHFESALHSSEERAHALFEQSIGLARVDLTGALIEANQKLCQIVGYTHAELLGRSVQEITYAPDLEPDLAYAERLLAGEIPTYTIEKRYIHKNGTLVWINLTVSLVREPSGAPKYFISVIEDISARKQAEEALRQSESRFARVFQTSLVALGIVRLADGRIIDVNESYCRLLGYRADELRGQAIDELNIRADPNQRLDIVRLLHQQESAYTYETTLRARSGDIREVLASVETIELDGDLCCLDTFIDITARKRAEQERQTASERFAGIVGSAMDAIISIDHTRSILLFNDAAETMFGCSAAAAIGTSIDQFFPFRLHEFHAQHIQAFSETGATRRTMGGLGKLTARRADGEEFPIEATISQLVAAGQKIYTVIVRDTTERDRAEATLQRYAERLTHLYEIDQAILSMRSLEAITHAAAAHLRHLVPTTHISVSLIDQQTNESSVLALRLDGEIHVGEEARILLRENENMMACLLRGEVYVIDDLLVWPQALAAFQVAGAERVRSYISVPIISNTELIGAIGLGANQPGAFLPEHVDITREVASQLSVAIRQMRLREQNQRHTRQLEIANKELEAFSYTVSHDLRAPLRAIDGFSRILQEEHLAHLPPEAQEYLDVIRQNAQQMDQLIHDLLAFARLSRQSLHKQLVAPADLVRQVIDELREEQDGRQIALHIGDLPVCMADPALLKQVYANLIANALKFTRGRAQARIEIGAHLDAGRADAPVYFVHDNGTGFDMRYVDKLFGVFQRLHHAEDYEGTGVGLATVQRIVLRHGGRAWAKGEVDHGATISFTLGGESTYG